MAAPFTFAAKIPTETITINGSATIAQNNDLENHIPARRYVFQSSTSYTGPDGSADLVTDKIIGTSMVNGHLAYSYDISRGYYITFGIRDERGEQWPADQSMSNIINGSSIIATIESTGEDSSEGLIPGSSTIYFYLAGSACKKYENGYCAAIRVNLNLTIKNSSCQIITQHNMAFTWPNIRPSEIINGSVAKQTAPVTMACSQSTGASPVAITFTSSNGSSDAANGVVKTSLENLGLQLTWASNGQFIPLDKEIDFPAIASATEDFSVNAKPVQIGSGKINGGNFSTIVTMSVEYR